MATKSANGGILFYIKNVINYKRRPDLNMNNNKELESIFIEILTKNLKIFLLNSSIDTLVCRQRYLFNNLDR